MFIIISVRQNSLPSQALRLSISCIFPCFPVHSNLSPPYQHLISRFPMRDFNVWGFPVGDFGVRDFAVRGSRKAWAGKDIRQTIADKGPDDTYLSFRMYDFS